MVPERAEAFGNGVVREMGSISEPGVRSKLVRLQGERAFVIMIPLVGLS